MIGEYAGVFVCDQRGAVGLATDCPLRTRLELQFLFNAYLQLEVGRVNPKLRLGIQAQYPASGIVHVTCPALQFCKSALRHLQKRYMSNRT